jgi:hypothetical protein
MVDIVDALKYPFSNLRKFAISAIINLFWFLMLPIFFINGYIITVIRSTLQNKNELPEWNDMFGLLKQGFILTMIQFIYIMIPVLISYFAFSTMGITNVQVLTPDNMPMVSSFSFILLTVSTLLFILVLFIMPMVTMVYAASEDMRTAFNLRIILEKIMIAPIDYMVVFSASTVMYLAFIILIPMLSVFIGLVLIYHSLFNARLFARTFQKYI